MSIYGSGSDSEDEEDLNSLASTVIIDAWQNQRFKPLQGGWTMPFVDIGVPYFSDLSGARKIDFETDEDDGEVVPKVIPKEGWRFVDEWEIDMSGAYGDVDAEGWSYATSFENLFEQSKKKTLKGEMGRLSLVRRRRWVRVKECSGFTKVGFKELMSWNDQLGLRLGQILDEKEAEFKMYLEHYTARMEQAEVTIQYSTNGMEEIISVLSHIVRKLKFVKEFLKERGEIEAQHAAALESFAEKWKDTGGKPKELAERDGKEEEEQDFGFFTCVCTADALASSRMTSFSFMLSESLPQDVDSVLEEAQSILHDCISDEISPRIAAVENRIKSTFSAYKTAMHAVRVASVAERGRLQSTLLSESAADGAREPLEDRSSSGGDDRARTMSRMSASGAGRDSVESTSAASGGGGGTTSYAGIVQKADVFIALRDYRLAMLQGDSLVTKFSAFVKQQRKGTRLLGIRIQALLQAMVKMFSHEFKRLYEDTSADLSRFLGSVEQAQQLQKRLSQQGESVAGSGRGWQSRGPRVERSASGIRYHGEEKEEVLELSNPQFPPIPTSAVIARKGVLKIAVTKNVVETPPPTPPVERTRTISFSPVDLMQSASAAAGVAVTPTRPTTPLSASSSSAAASSASASSGASSATMGVVGPCEWTPTLPGADSKLCSWLYVMVIVTYDASMLVFPPTETKSAITDEVFKYGEPWLRLGLAGASVQPLLLQDGDAFSVRTKYCPCALMVDDGQGPQEVVEWMRVCLNPVADPAKEPPTYDGGAARAA